MFHLFIVVLSISLMGGMILASISYTDLTRPVQNQAEKRVELGFNALNDAWNQFRIDNRQFDWTCETFESNGVQYEHCERTLQDEGILPVLGWGNNLIPSYLFTPVTPGTTNWSYGMNPTSGKYYFCLSGQVTDTHLKGILRAQSNQPINQMIIGSSCGSSSNLAVENIDVDDIAITYWVQTYHPDM